VRLLGRKLEWYCREVEEKDEFLLLFYAVRRIPLNMTKH
jgi:hypothetical protein